MNHLRRLAAVGVVALVAAGCGDGGGGGTAGGGGDPCTEDEFGCVEIAPGDPIRLASLLVITTADAPLGTDSQRAVEMGLDYHPDETFDGTAGELLGHPLELQPEDDQCSADGGQAGATKLASDPTIVSVVGTSCSSAALGVADRILSDAGILLVSPSNTNAFLTSADQHEPFYARTAHSDAVQGAVDAVYAFNELGWETAVTIHDESVYSDGLATVFAERFTELGGEVLSEEAVASDDTDFRQLLTSIAADAPDGIFMPMFIAAGGGITAQASEEAGLADTELFGADGMTSPDYIEAAGAEAAESVLLSGPDTSAFESGDFYQNEFVPTYQETYGEKPTAAFHAHSFDATGMILQAIEEVAVEGDDGSLQIPRTALKDAFFAISGYQGITGELACTELGECQTNYTIGVFKVAGGAIPETPEFSLDPAGIAGVFPDLAS
ncbi:MAG: branched-chain amino acid ABC transporter substrate-binding protein [Actinomycetota bacterium]